MDERTCNVPGCFKPARSKSAEWCKMHYHRWYRHGRLDAVAAKSGVTASNGRRYRRVSARKHPLADRNGLVYEHRKVLYDSIGPGLHACHWCGTELVWLPKGDPRCLNVDHLNGWGDDNRPENLVPSCSACNTARGQQARAAALREAGWWSSHDTVAQLRDGGRRPLVEPARVIAAA